MNDKDKFAEFIKACNALSISVGNFYNDLAEAAKICLALISENAVNPWFLGLRGGKNKTGHLLDGEEWRQTL